MEPYQEVLQEEADLNNLLSELKLAPEGPQVCEAHICLRVHSKHVH